MPDPEQYRDAKARASAHDPLAAVAVGNPLRDRCIDAVQQRLMHLALARLDLGSMRAPPSALDMGCGTGRWADDLRRAGFDYHGIDISSAMIGIARRENPAARFEKFDGRRIPHPDRRFDLVVSMAVVHHNAYPQQEALLDELVRVLAPGGTLLMLEGIGARTSDEDGVFFLRPIADWSAALVDRGLRLEWQRGARYFALEHIGRSAVKRLGLGSGELLAPALLRIGAVVDPYFISGRPNRLHDRWLAMWRK